MDQYPQQPGQPGYQQQPGYPPTQPGYPQQPGYPPTQPGYPQQPGYPPGQPGYPQQPSYQPGQPGYPQQPGYPPAQPGYPQQPGQPGYPPAQALYPGQFQQGSVAVQTPSKSRKGMWIGIIIVVAILLGGGVIGYTVLQGQSSPTATLQHLCDSYKTQNAQEAYDTLSAKYQRQTTIEIVQRAMLLLKGTSIDCTVSNVQQNGSTATGTITLTRPIAGRPVSSSGHVSLIQENNQWKIDNIT